MPSPGAIRAGKAAYELFADDSKLIKSLKSIEAKLKGWASKVSAFGKKVAAGSAAVLAPLAGAATAFGSIGTEFQQMAARTGASVEALSTLGYAAEAAGGSLNDIEGALASTRGKLVDCAKGSTEAQKAFLRLGLDWRELSQMAPEDQFRKISAALKTIPNPALRASLAAETLGSADLLPVIDQLDEMEERARSLGLEMSGEDAASAKEFTMSMGDLAKTVKSVAVNIGSALAPTASKVVETITETVVTVSKWIKQNRDLIVTVAKIAAIALAAGVAIGTVGAILYGIASVVGVVIGILTTVGTVLTAAFGAAVTAVTFLISPIGLVIAAVVGLGVYVATTTGAIQESLDWLAGVFGDLKDDALEAFEGISAAISSGDIAGAITIVGNLLKLEWLKAVQYMRELWIGFKEVFLTVWDEATGGLAKILLSTWAAIETGWTETIDFLSDAWSLFATGLQKTWHTAIGFIQKGWVRLKGLFDKDINVDAEVAKINEQTDAKNQGADDSRDQAIFEREKARQKQLADIEKARAGAISEVEAEKGRKADARRAANAQELADAQRELADARNAFHDSVNTAKEKKARTARDKRDQVKGPGSPGLETLGSNVSGTFSAAAAGRSFGGNRQLDSIAESTKETAKNTRNMSRPSPIAVS